MSPIICPFCEKASPPDAKFCSACGGALYLAPCPNCGAVNDLSAACCYQCRSALPRGKADLAELPEEAPRGEKAATRRPAYARIAAGAAVLLTVGALGYYAYEQRSPADSPLSTVGRTSGQVAPGAAGLIGPQPAVEPAHMSEGSGVEPVTPSAPTQEVLHAASGGAAPDSGPTPVGPISSKSASAVPTAAAARPSQSRAAALQKPRVIRQNVESPQPRALAVPSSGGQGTCTAAVEALGLCQPAMRPTERASATISAGAPAESQGAGAASAQESAQATAAAKVSSVKPAPAPAKRLDACADAVAALGLCTQSSKTEAKGE